MVKGAAVIMAAAVIMCGGAGVAAYFVARSISKDTCNTSATCPKGYTCSFGKCVRTAQCLGDADCASGTVCRNTVCVKPAQCSQDLDCKGFPKEVCDTSTMQCVVKV
jgi:Cys-rich repeat protein